jgi:hypothetical protein
MTTHFILMLDQDEVRRGKGKSRTETALMRVSRRPGFFWFTPRAGRWIDVAGRLDECQGAALDRHARQLNGSSLALWLSILTHGRLCRSTVSLCTICLFASCGVTR